MRTMTNIAHYEFRSYGAPRGISPTGDREYSVIKTTTNPKTAALWMRYMNPRAAREHGVYAVTANGDAYRLEMEMGCGPIGYDTQEGWVTI